ncbi:MAG: MerR family transcriptional regulator [Aerococcus suis]|nr:MerR family transcriptional regulator [Aerococcus suis]MDD7758005.1 MerR family transcriptional regulator [Aerococcus suis]MDY4646476.1 MerR family transcriptional regulator [Aerococcus suis]
MKEKELRRSLAVFPIGTVMKLTDLSARQVRYYEERDLITPQRTDTNRRMYSLNDVDRLLDIKDYIAEGWTVQAIYNHYKKPKEEHEHKPLTDDDVRRILYNEILNQGGFVQPDESGYSGQHH